jgi:hypothetical protein
MRAMAIVARNLESVSLVVVAGETLPLPDPAEVFAHFTGAEAKAARMLDDAALHLRSFLLPGVDMRIIFEPTRVRFEALNPKKPSEEKFAERAAQSLHALYPKRPFPRIGFNYDIAYQYDAVIQQRVILGAFLDKDTLEDTTHFGWQFSLAKEKGTRRETYFCKVVSPLELRIMANIEHDRPLSPAPAETQALYERCYTECQEIVEHLKIS